MQYLKTGLIYLIALPLTIWQSAYAYESNENKLTVNQRNFQYQEATKFTNINWSASIKPNTVYLLPTVNHSGIPFEDRNETFDYYEHGKIPSQSYDLLGELLTSSKNLQLSSQPDYLIQFSIEEYKLPFSYAPDDKWWEKASDNLDRAFASANPASVKMSVTVTSGNRPLIKWQDSVTMTVTHCDLNATTQPMSVKNSQNETLKAYSLSTSGQAFIAASNFLITKVIQRLQQEPALAAISKKHGNEIMLKAETGRFTQGEELNVYYNKVDGKISSMSAGKIQVIKTYGNEAVAYPVTLRADHLKIGDKVALNGKRIISPLRFRFTPNEKCAPVAIAEAN